MKIAVTGKGGVGKTTFAACLARLYADEGRKVLCADVDPDANLGLALGFKEEDLEKITPITEMKDLIKQRTHADEFERFFKINPKVDDLPDMLSYEINGVKLLLMGTVKVGGQGCVCPEHVILKRLLSHLIIQRDGVVIMEPGARSIQTYHSVQRLAKDLGVARVSVVANKVRDEKDEAFIRENVPEEDLLGMVHLNGAVSDADRACASPYDTAPETVEEIRRIKEKIDRAAKADDDRR